MSTFCPICNGPSTLSPNSIKYQRARADHICENGHEIEARLQLERPGPIVPGWVLYQLCDRSGAGWTAPDYLRVGEYEDLDMIKDMIMRSEDWTRHAESFSLTIHQNVPVPARVIRDKRNEINQRIASLHSTCETLLAELELTKLPITVGLVTPWIDDGHAAFRSLAGKDPNEIEHRVAFIEKTPRVRVAGYTSRDDDCHNWHEGTCGRAPEYGKYQPSRNWCDRQLHAMGFTLPEDQPAQGDAP
jgi:hypothetical protein